jgi:hypothetical protein
MFHFRWSQHTCKIYDEENGGGGGTHRCFPREISPSNSLVQLIQQSACLHHHYHHHKMQHNCCIHTVPHETTMIQKLHNKHSEDTQCFELLHSWVVWWRNTVPFILSSSEPWCHLSGYMNSQNYKSHSLTHKVPLHDLKRGTWCAECKWNFFVYMFRWPPRSTLLHNTHFDIIF